MNPTGWTFGGTGTPSAMMAGLNTDEEKMNFL
jgi:hypothetical protein